MTTKTRGAGKGKRHVSTTVPEPVYKLLEELAETSGITPTAYARKAIIRTVNAMIRFQETEVGPDKKPISIGFPIAEIPPAIEEESLFRAAEKPEHPYGTKKATAGRKTS